MIMILGIGLAGALKGFANGHFSPFFGAVQGTPGTTPGGIGMAMISAMWAFDGWNTANCMTEEMKNPRRDLLPSIFMGVGTATGSYVLMNLSYLCSLSAFEMTESSAVASDMAVKVMGLRYARAIVQYLIFGCWLFVVCCLLFGRTLCLVFHEV
jgi:amino acid transporter